jgi:predicted homoserine dehydrogenase-like protein
MSLIQKLKARAANNNPVRVGIIGPGRFRTGPPNSNNALLMRVSSLPSNMA